MSLIACKDKRRKKRVIASDLLPRIDYYCPNEKCDAILRLVDCDDEIRRDHFRVKVGYNHIKNCPYANENEKLEINNFTSSEILTLNLVLNDTKKNLLKLNNSLNTYTSNTIKKENPIIYDAFLKWLDYNLSQNHTFIYVSSKIKQLTEFINTFEIDKFKFYTRYKNNIIARCLPFKTCKISLSSSFFSLVDNINKQGVIIHEATHQLFWTNDFGGYGLKVSTKKSKTKQWNAENWENCLVDIFKQWNNFDD